MVHHLPTTSTSTSVWTNGTAPTRSSATATAVFRTYFINNRGDEVFVNTWNFLDMTALGRQETWEDSPEGYPQTKPYEWWDWHDEYGKHEPSRWFGEPDPNDPNDQPPRDPG